MNRPDTFFQWYQDTFAAEGNVPTARDVWNAAMKEATRICDSRSASLSESGKHSEANEAHKCGTAIGGSRQ